MTTCRLAVSGAPLSVQKGFNVENPPAILVSYVYLNAFRREFRPRCKYRNWMMDSGAFSAYNCGKVIDIEQYIVDCKRIREEEKDLVEIIALDVIGDAKASLKNALYMKKKGVEVVPVHHIGDDWGILKEYLANFDKVGLSCLFGEPRKESFKYYDRCFSIGWPKKFHSFGWMMDNVVLRYPFHSADSASWRLAAQAYGYWIKYGRMSVKHGDSNLKPQVEYYLELERRAKIKWKKEMQILEHSNGTFENSIS